ncbi:cyclic-phosphate processing receiver domain-containing protein [Paraburkholderia dilworthii]|uniref:cyclic-phosphate processing receiver domain-containing protein n=1 Tax=Paraburkholderia dilworthii TaxID=948106 RepID=UPI0004893179|nr:cyclic-phosphate processing receiver domain-containing protein [Paraburkholderia dilworthii]
MTYRLFIDDLRQAPDDSWVVARSSDKALSIIAERGCPREISFDHDLGGHDTAMTVVKALVEFDLDAGGRYIPPDFDFVVHSSNPVGARNISGLLQGYLQARDERRN